MDKTTDILIPAVLVAIMVAFVSGFALGSHEFVVATGLSPFGPPPVAQCVRGCVKDSHNPFGPPPVTSRSPMCARC